MSRTKPIMPCGNRQHKSESSLRLDRSRSTFSCEFGEFPIPSGPNGPTLKRSILNLVGAWKFETSHGESNRASRSILKLYFKIYFKIVF